MGIAKSMIAEITVIRFPEIMDYNTVILRFIGITRTFDTVADVYQSQALDPHVNRHLFR